MVSKGVDCYSFITHSDHSVRFEVPGKKREHRKVNEIEKGNLQVKSSEIKGVFDYTGKFEWQALKLGSKVASKNNKINTLTGNLEGGDMTDMLKTPPIFKSDCSICYGFYDSGAGILGITNQDQSYAYYAGNYSRWMEGLTSAFPEAAHRPFREFALPGAHDAGMNTLKPVKDILNSTGANVLLGLISILIPGAKSLTKKLAPLAIQNFALTQKDSITQMLDIGTRYFDFRPGYMVSELRGLFGELYHQHWAIPGMRYSAFLEELLVWLAANPGEVVVVSCGTAGFKDKDMKPKPADLNKVLDAARAKTGVTTAMLIAGDKTALSKTIAQLRESKTRLIFLNQIDKETTKYDSYDDDAYGTLDPNTIVKQLGTMTKAGQAGKDYTVLQLQGTCTLLGNVIASSAITGSSCSSPLLMTKAQFDKATLAWAFANTDRNLSKDYLTILLNDFSDNATVSTCIDVTKKRMGLWK